MGIFLGNYPSLCVFTAIVLVIAALVVVGSPATIVLAAMLSAPAVGFGFIALLEIL